MSAPVTGPRVAGNAAAAFGGQLVILLLGLAATAVIVRVLGAPIFGAWSLIGAFIAYAALMDMGLSIALVRRIADAEARDDRRSSGAALGASLVVTTLTGLAAAIVMLLLAPAAASWLDIPVGIRAEFVRAFRIAGLGAALAVPAAALGAVPAALQQLRVLVRLDVTVAFLTLLAQIVAVTLGAGMTALAWALVGGRVVALVGRWLLARRLLGDVSFALDRGYPLWESLGRFGAIKVVHQLMSQVVLYLDRVLVGVFVSLEAVAYYTVALELAQRLLMIQTNVAQAYYPAACALAGDRASFQRLYLGTARAVSLFTFPAAITLAVLAEPLLRLWVGWPMALNAAPILTIVALAYAGMALTAIPAATADALDHPGMSVRYGMVSLVLNVVFVLLLVPRMGAIGAAWAIAINVLVPTPFFLHAVSGRLAGVNVPAFVRRAIAEPLVPALLLGAVLIAGWRALDSIGSLRLPVTLALGLAAFLPALRLTRFDSEERAFIAGIPGGRLVTRLAGRA